MQNPVNMSPLAREDTESMLDFSWLPVGKGTWKTRMFSRGQQKPRDTELLISLTSRGNRIPVISAEKDVVSRHRRCACPDRCHTSETETSCPLALLYMYSAGTAQNQFAPWCKAQASGSTQSQLPIRSAQQHDMRLLTSPDP